MERWAEDPSRHLRPAAQLPADGGIFDTVYANSVLEHVRSIRRAVPELGRVLAPGGVTAPTGDGRPDGAVLRTMPRFRAEDLGAVNVLVTARKPTP